MRLRLAFAHRIAYDPLLMSAIPYLGETFALLAAICWSFAVILFRKSGEKVPALALNLFKNGLAIVLFTGTLLLKGESLIGSAPARDYAILLVSGAIGIGLADTFFFLTLNRVGAGLQAIITTTYSPSIILLGVLFLGERLLPLQILGVALILGAVLAVSWIRDRGREPPRRVLAAGILFGCLATSTQAVAVVMMKPLLGSHSLLWANLLRLLGGEIMGLLLLPFLPRMKESLATLRDRRAWKVMIPASVIGTYVSLLFWLGGMKYTQVSTASAINQTATLWTFLLAALLLHEPVSRPRILGLVLGVGGVALVTFGRLF